MLRHSATVCRSRGMEASWPPLQIRQFPEAFLLVSSDRKEYEGRTMSKPNSEFDSICTEVFTNRVGRRHFIYTTLLAAGALTTPAILAKPKYKSPNEKLNIGGIGVTGKGQVDLGGVAETENIVVLCDIDDEKIAAAKQKYPKA